MSMSRDTPDAYVHGEKAGSKFSDNTSDSGVVECPYPDGTHEAEQWWKGFGNSSGLVEFLHEM